MTKRFLILISILLFLGCCNAWATAPCGDLPNAVMQLGLEKEPTKTIELLHACGKKAIPLLISQLHVMDPEALNDEWEHQIWVERALRSITGQYFVFVSSQKLSPRLARIHQQSDSLGLAMEWMSRGEIFMAPQDVQANVIKAWKTWWKKNAASFKVQPYEPFGDWYF